MPDLIHLLHERRRLCYQIIVPLTGEHFKQPDERNAHIPNPD